jgi:hypothetical protein
MEATRLPKVRTTPKQLEGEQMKKQTSRITGIVALIVFAVVAMTAVFADSNARPLATPESNAAVPSPTPPAKKVDDRVVGTCNTAKGCVALRDACKSLKKHSFKPTKDDGSLGMCVDQNPATATFYLRNSNAPKSPNTPAAPVGLAAPTNTSEATLYCHGAVFCRKVKNICAALGGNYTPIYDTSGSCQY